MIDLVDDIYSAGSSLLRPLASGYLLSILVDGLIVYHVYLLLGDLFNAYF